MAMHSDETATYTTGNLAAGGVLNDRDVGAV
jgi:hypothetical protein